MKVIENYKRAVENSDESLLNEVFSPDVRLEVPAGPGVDYPGNIASLILSQVAKTLPASNIVRRISPPCMRRRRPSMRRRGTTEEIHHVQELSAYPR
jgi:hypothetical protein